MEAANSQIFIPKCFAQLLDPQMGVKKTIDLRRCIALKLPNGVRNISKKFNNSNNIILSAEDKLAVSGIRQEIIVWDMDTGCLVKRLIAHFQVSCFYEV